MKKKEKRKKNKVDSKIEKKLQKEQVFPQEKTARTLLEVQLNIDAGVS